MLQDSLVVPLASGFGRNAAAEAADQSAAAPAAGPGRPGLPAGGLAGGGFGGGRGSSYSRSSNSRGGAIQGLKRQAGQGLGGVRLRDSETDEELEVDSVQIVGKETLYKRGKQWFAANAKDVDLQRDAAKIKSVKRFSAEYFTLTSKNSTSENAVLARQQDGEELIIKLRGQVYRIH